MKTEHWPIGKSLFTIVCLINLSHTVSDGATKISLLNIDMWIAQLIVPRKQQRWKKKFALFKKGKGLWKQPMRFIQVKDSGLKVLGGEKPSKCQWNSSWLGDPISI